MPHGVYLTADQMRTLVSTSRDQIADAHKLLDAACRAGINCDELRADLVRAEELRVGLISEFAPRGVRQP